MKKNAFIMLMTAMLLLGGCSTPGSVSSPSQKEPVSVFTGEPKALAAPNGEENAASQTAAKGANDFAFRLSAELLTDNGSENFVCSPYSVWLPLAALLNATDEANREALLSALSAEGITVEDINLAASRMLYDLTKEQEREFGREYGEEIHNPLQIANAIFVRKNETLNTKFAQTFMDYYRGQAMTVDFSSQSAVDAVNQWASEHTEGLIDEIIQEFDPQTVAAIANAIYFSDRWQWEFDPAKTTEDVFHSPDGDGTASFMLREGDALTYYEDDRVQAMPLRFKSGGTMYILLPKDGDASGLLSSMDHAYLEEIQRDSIQATGKLLLPRFKIESGMIPLRDALEALGVPLFDDQTAPLTGGLIEGDLPVWLSSAVQKAMIEVDEKGTTAAAVTVMEAAGAAMPIPTEPFEMICNKPFVFVLCDYTYDAGSQILFTGVVNQPE